jgi:hypothetical protein
MAMRVAKSTSLEGRAFRFKPLGYFEGVPFTCV